MNTQGTAAIEEISVEIELTGEVRAWRPKSYLQRRHKSIADAKSLPKGAATGSSLHRGGPMVISTRPCSLDSAGGGVSTAGLLLQRCQRTQALRRWTLVLDLMDKAERMNLSNE